MQGLKSLRFLVTDVLKRASKFSRIKALSKTRRTKDSGYAIEKPI